MHAGKCPSHLEEEISRPRDLSTLKSAHTLGKVPSGLYACCFIIPLAPISMRRARGTESGSLIVESLIVVARNAVGEK